MKKHLFLPLCLMAAFAAWALPVAYAQSDDAKPAKTAKSGKSSKKKGKKKKKKKAPLGAVGEAMAKLQDKALTDAKPATDAEFYIYLVSASWCGPCNQEMPHVVEAYKKMRETNRVELILLSADSTPEAAKGFVEKYNGTFPVVMGKECSSTLPGFSNPSGIPHCIYVDKDGKVIQQGHGHLVMQWEQFTKAPEPAPAEEAEATTETPEETAPAADGDADAKPKKKKKAEA